MPSPWERPPEEERRPPGRTIRWRFLIILLLIGAGLFGLNFAFPDWGGRGSTFSLVYNVSWITLLAASAIAFSRTSMKIHARNALIWLGIFILVIVGASFWEEWRGLGSRVAGSLVPGRVIEEDRHAHRRCVGRLRSREPEEPPPPRVYPGRGGGNPFAGRYIA